MATEALPQGTLIDGRYDIRDRLGQGGMGTVYRARDMKMGQIVALKVMPPGPNESEKTRKDRLLRFAREIMAINEVRHPNVLNVQEFGFDKDTPYMVMEFLEGEDLGKIMRERSEPLAIDHAVDIVLATCAAIRACHDEGVIHRDLKPGNIMIIKRDFGAGWDVKVVDFGISKTAGASDLTQEGKIVGTPHFLAPEQITADVLPASDQYAIGVLLYYCLTKHHPYEGFETLKLIRAIERGAFPPPRSHRPEIPEKLEQIILTAMRVDPAQRHASVFEFGRELLEFASPLGRQFWQRYYATPPILKPKGTAKVSSFGIPLVHRMAEGQVPISAATVQVSFSKTTAVAEAPELTLREGADANPVAAATTSGGPTQLSQTGPSGRDWAKQSSKLEVVRTPDPAAGPITPGGAPPASRRFWIGAGLATTLACGVVVALVVGRVGRRTVEPASAPQPAPTAPAVSAPMPPRPPPIAPGPPVNAAAPRAVAPVPEPTAGSAPPPMPTSPTETKPKHHHHSHSSVEAPGWAKDPQGNVIPPP
jgi:serine/threonine protein kinase